MKVDRRSFLGLGLGAAAGVAVSPVGIKLTDDSSIWTQNWPWTPVPADGEATYDKSVCSLCPGGCGISVRKIDNRPVKIEGLKGYPVNDGGACLHGIAGLQYLYDPSRVKTPLKKNTEGKFEPISWDVALEMVSAKLSDIRKNNRSEKLACIVDREEGSVAGLFKRLLSSFGSPNFYTMPSLESNLQATAASIHGQGKTIGFDLENSDFILSFGAGVLEGWGSPVNCFKANASKKEREGKLYQVEPRLSNTATSADHWIPINPGTEADLALGLCAAIVKNNLKTSVSTAGFSGNFPKLAAILEKEYSAAQASALTGIDPTEIEKLAALFVKAKNPVAVFGKGRGDGSQSLKEMTAVQLLNCLAGNINQKGGAFVMDTPNYLQFPGESSDSVATAASNKKKAGLHVHQLFEAVGLASAPVIEALLVYNANPCYALHTPDAVKKAMGNIPFVVSLSSFLDETAQQADVVLPVHTFLEKIEDVPSGAGLSKTMVGLTRPIVKPVFDSRHPGDIIISIARALDAGVADNFKWETYEECLENVTAAIWESLSEDGYALISKDAPASDADVNVSFLSNRPDTIKAQGDYNYTLIPIDNMRLVSAATAASPFAIKTVADTVIKGKDIVVEINPKTAKSIGLKDCGYANVTTPVGKARVMVTFSDGMMPGVIGMVEGLGHISDNTYVAGKGVNVKTLIGPVIESGSGLDAAFGIKANITKA